MEYDYLEFDEALEAHAEAVGCSADQARDALLNDGRLASALARAQNAAVYEQADLARQAATLFWGIAAGHPFRDGNKRTAVAILRSFLFINGHTHALSEDALFDLALKIADARCNVEEIEAVLRPVIVPDNGS